MDTGKLVTLEGSGVGNPNCNFSESALLFLSLLNTITNTVSKIIENNFSHNAANFFNSAFLFFELSNDQ